MVSENLFLIYLRNPSTSIWCNWLVWFDRKLNIWTWVYNSTSTGTASYPDLINSGALEDYFGLVSWRYDNKSTSNTTHQFGDVNILLQRLFVDTWVATNGSIRWPPRFPDLTLFDFYFRDYVKDEVHEK